jgi:hypothetical protein
LSRAVNQALSGDTISIGAGTFPSLNNIELNVAKNLVINGAGSSQTIFDLNKQGKEENNGNIIIIVVLVMLSALSSSFSSLQK